MQRAKREGEYGGGYPGVASRCPNALGVARSLRALSYKTIFCIEKLYD